MSEAFLHPIARIEALPGYRLLVHWRDGGQSVADFSDDIAHGPVWAPLRDERLFAGVRLVRGGTWIEWPEPRLRNGAPAIDVDADGLWSMAAGQKTSLAAE